MAISKEIPVTSSFTGAMKGVQQIYEEQLRSMWLGADQILQQDLGQLHRSLERINEAIRHQDSFNILRLSITGEAEIVIAKSSSDMHFEMRITPLLLEHKSLIVERIVELKGKERIESLQDVLFLISDDETRNRLSNKLDLLESNCRESQTNLLELTRHHEVEKSELNELLTKTRKQKRVYDVVLRLVVGAILIVLGIYTIFILPSNISWQWLLTHPRKLALQVSALVLLLGIVWGLLDTNGNRRVIALGSITIAALVGAIQFL